MFSAVASKHEPRVWPDVDDDKEEVEEVGRASVRLAV